MFQNPNFQSTVILNRLALVEEQGLQAQPIRPLVMEMNQEKMNFLVGATNNGANFTPAALRNIATDILKPSAQTEGIAAIPNDWGSARFSFMMDVTVRNGYSSIEHRAIISGYTDVLGVHQTPTGQMLLDPNMRMYFNNCTRVTVSQVPTPQGAQLRLGVLASEQILRPTVVPTFNNPVTSEYTIRPQDAMTVGGSAEMMQQEGIYVENFHASFADGVKMNDRNDMDPARYLSRTITKYARVYDDSEQAGGVYDNVSMAEQTAAALTQSNAPAFVNPIIEIVNKTFGFNDVNGAIGSISYSQLCQLDPSTDAKVGVYLSKPIERQNRTAQIQDSRQFMGADDNSLAVSIINRVMPTILTRYLLGRLEVTITNDNLSGEVTAEWHNVRGFSEQLNVQPIMPLLYDSLITDLFNPISMFGQRRVSVRILTDVNQHTDILISINGSQPEFFSTLTSADQLFSPMVARNYQTVVGLSSDLLSLSQQMAGLQSQPNTNGAQQWNY